MTHETTKLTKPSQIDRHGLSNWEWMIGAKGIALVGVLILVIAAGLFFKEVWDRGLLALIPDWLRCALGGAFGIVMLGLGEILRRKINPLASSGVSGAGIAIIFGSIMAAAQLYELLLIPVAFIFAAIGDGTPQQMVFLSWAVVGTLMLGAGIWPTKKGPIRSQPILRRWLLPQLAVAISVFYALIWVVWQSRLNWSWIDALPMLHPAFASGMIAATTLGVGSWRLKHARRIPGIR